MKSFGAQVPGVSCIVGVGPGGGGGSSFPKFGHEGSASTKTIEPATAMLLNLGLLSLILFNILGLSMPGGIISFCLPYCKKLRRGA
jgi:hypothetical protein